MNHDRLSHFFQPGFLPLNDPAMPYPFGPSVAAPHLVACVVHPSFSFAAQGLYQLAYEQALAAVRTSRFEVAGRACAN